MSDMNMQQAQSQQQQTIITKSGKILDPQQMHVCRLCDKLLSSSSSLDRHMLTHSGERPFVCKRCHMTFTTNGNMHRHMRTHLHKDSLARQQREQLQLKQSLLVGGANASSGQIPSDILESGFYQATAASANTTTTSQHHHHNQQQQQLTQRLAQQPGSVAALAGPLASLVASNIGVTHQHNHHQDPVTALFNQQLLAAAFQQPGVLAANNPGKHQPVIQGNTSGNQKVSTTFEHQQQQQPQHHHQYHLSQQTDNISTAAAAAAAAAASQQLIQNQQHSNHLSQQQQQQQQALVTTQMMQAQQQASMEQQQQHLDPEALMMSAALAAAGYQQTGQSPNQSVESMKTVMFAAAAAAVAAATAAALNQQQEAAATGEQCLGSGGVGGGGNNLLMEQPSSSRMRRKRRKQVNPLRSSGPSDEGATTAAASISASSPTSSSSFEHLAATSNNEDFNQDDISSSSPTSSMTAAAAATNATNLSMGLKFEPDDAMDDKREDFNNNNQTIRLASSSPGANLQRENGAGRRRAGNETLGSNSDNDDDDDIDDESEERDARPMSVDYDEVSSASRDNQMQQQQQLRQQRRRAREHTARDKRQRQQQQQVKTEAPATTFSADRNWKLRSAADDSEHGPAAFEACAFQRVTAKRADAGENEIGNADLGFDPSETNETFASAHVSNRRRILEGDEFNNEGAEDLDDDDDNNDEDQDAGRDGRRQTELDEDEENNNKRMNSKMLEARDQNDSGDDINPNDRQDDQWDCESELSAGGGPPSDVSQSYVKTANPNATRKGGKRNRHCYKCKLCTYSSVDRCTLVRHLRIHSGERPYICGICRYAFTTKANCERHVRKRHKKQYNSLGGSGGVKGSNGGGRSLIITDHSNHQTIPVKVNPVAAQTILQTLQRIQEKEQQQHQRASFNPMGVQFEGEHIGLTHENDHIVRIGNNSIDFAQALDLSCKLQTQK